MTVEAPHLMGQAKHETDLFEQKAAYKRRRKNLSVFNSNLGILWSTTRLGPGEFFAIPQNKKKG